MVIKPNPHVYFIYSISILNSLINIYYLDLILNIPFPIPGVFLTISLIFLLAGPVKPGILLGEENDSIKPYISGRIYSL